MSKFAGIGKGGKNTENAKPALGRPKSADTKRGNPDYQSLTVYVTKPTHTAAKVKLAGEGGARDMSDVIEDLLSRWAAGKL